MPVPNLLPQSWHTEVRKARKARRMSQREVEERTGIHQTQLSRIENGVVDARVSDAIQMARAVDLEFVLVPRRALPDRSYRLHDRAHGRWPSAFRRRVAGWPRGRRMSDVLVVRLHGQDVGEIVRFPSGQIQFEFYPAYAAQEGPPHPEPVVPRRQRRSHGRWKTYEQRRGAGFLLEPVAGRRNCGPI